MDWSKIDWAEANASKTTDEYDVNFANHISWLKGINTTLGQRKDVLGFEAVEGVSDDLKFIYGFMEWDKDVILTAERLREFEKKLAERTEDYQEVVATLDEVLPTYDAQEALDTVLKNKEVKRATSISTSKVAA